MSAAISSAQALPPWLISPSPGPLQNTSKRDPSTAANIGAIIGGLFFFFVVAAVIFTLRRRLSIRWTTATRKKYNSKRLAMESKGGLKKMIMIALPESTYDPDTYHDTRKPSVQDNRTYEFYVSP